MEINEEDIIGTYILEDGCRYLFMSDKSIYKEDVNGKITKVELNEKNIDEIQKKIGTGPTDVIR